MPSPSLGLSGDLLLAPTRSWSQPHSLLAWSTSLGLSSRCLLASSFSATSTFLEFVPHIHILHFPRFVSSLLGALEPDSAEVSAAYPRLHRIHSRRVGLWSPEGLAQGWRALLFSENLSEMSHILHASMTFKNFELLQ